MDKESVPRHLQPERRKYMQEWLLAHPNYRRSRYLANKDRLLELGRIWNKQNREQRRAIWRRYYRRYRAKHIERIRSWSKANPEKAKVYKAISGSRRRSQSKEIYDKRITSLYKRCQALRKWFDVQVDHIVPLSKGGRHQISNLQIIYAYENARKHTNINYKPRIIFK